MSSRKKSLLRDENNVRINENIRRTLAFNSNRFSKREIVVQVTLSKK